MQSEPTPEQVEARLRDMASVARCGCDALCKDALDTIASLRRALAERDAEVRALRAAIDTVAGRLSDGDERITRRIDSDKRPFRPDWSHVEAGRNVIRQASQDLAVAIRERKP